MFIRTILPALALAVAASTVGAQTLGDLDNAEAALVAAWEKTPLAARRAVFVTERAAQYGQFSERTNPVFKPGEALLTYVEPVGYAWKPAGPDGFVFGVTLDFVLKNKAGQILGGQEKFLNFSQTSKNRVRELFLNISLGLTGATPGEYVVEYTLRDQGSQKTTVIRQPFQIAAAAP